ncbi:MAG: type II secretion system F family protein [Candidatus Eremiobacteraeota bacterium]|nr:type II secretion system F family protein [Candidatus Eremiobacteraeota bacterium]
MNSDRRLELEPEPLPLGERRDFFVQMAVMFAAGCPLSKALLTLSRVSDRPRLAGGAERVLSSLEKGSSFSQALAQEGSFTRAEVGLVRMGEETGRLRAVLERLGENLSETLGYRRRLLEAGIYPVFAVVFSGLLISLMAFVFLPRILPVVIGFGVELPWPTRLVVAFSRLVPWLFPLGLAAAIALVLTLREPARQERLLFSLPLVKGVLRAASLAEASSALALLLSAGATLDRSFDLLAPYLPDPELRAAMGRLKTRLRSGHTLTEALAREPKLPPLWRQFMASGEESGRLEFFALQASLALRQEVGLQTDRAVSLFEPALLFFLGGVVGFLLLACFLPFYGLLEVVV